MVGKGLETLGVNNCSAEEDKQDPSVTPHFIPSHPIFIALERGLST